jgi:hypothetical protein
MLTKSQDALRVIQNDNTSTSNLIQAYQIIADNGSRELLDPWYLCMLEDLIANQFVTIRSA